MNLEQNHIPGCSNEMRFSGTGFRVVDNSKPKIQNSSLLPGLVGYMLETIKAIAA